MTGRIYFLNETSGLIAMEESRYDSEKLLQELLATHPDLLAGDQMDSDNPRRWLLVTREMSVPGEWDSAGRWSLDHLFLDQDAIPTLVEVKRSSDHRLRRAVVGQLLDYAANAVVYWPVEKIRAAFEARCQQSGEAPDTLLATFLGEDQDADTFWQRVKTNLQAGRVRMVFIADVIPPELRRVVEFLNEQMDPAELLAVEVKQFVGQGMKTLVPRVIGQSETARQKKSSSTKTSKPFNESSFLEAVEQHKGEAAKKAAKDLLDWLTPQVTYLYWGNASLHGGVVPVIKHKDLKFHVGRIAAQGWFAFRFDWLYKKPPFNDESLRRQLLGMINAIPGVHFGDDVLTRTARVHLDKLTTANAMDKPKAAITFLIGHANAQCEQASVGKK